LGNVRFVTGDIHEAAAGGQFDAIVGRLVLMYVSDPAAVLRTQAALLRPGGVVAPIEFDLRSARSLPPTPLVGQLLEWLLKAFERAGIQPSLGPRLWATLLEAGLRPLGMIGIQPHFGPQDPDGPAILSGIVGAVLPLMERTGVATAQEVGIETLRRRLTDELVGNGRCSPTRSCCPHGARRLSLKAAATVHRCSRVSRLTATGRKSAAVRLKGVGDGQDRTENMPRGVTLRPNDAVDNHRQLGCTRLGPGACH
jgi:hypothetical protein